MKHQATHAENQQQYSPLDELTANHLFVEGVLKHWQPYGAEFCVLCRPEVVDLVLGHGGFCVFEFLAGSKIVRDLLGLPLLKALNEAFCLATLRLVAAKFIFDRFNNLLELPVFD